VEWALLSPIYSTQLCIPCPFEGSGSIDEGVPSRTHFFPPPIGGKERHPYRIWRTLEVVQSLCRLEGILRIKIHLHFFTHLYIEIYFYTCTSLYIHTCCASNRCSSFSRRAPLLCRGPEEEGFGNHGLLWQPKSVEAASATPSISISVETRKRREKGLLFNRLRLP
jgi:hypothetical protein